ncbi:MAG: leucyl aminopeptidase family protein [Pseudomonadota bacterium]|nr:leucyl aminopeptidase family protein [Pseudomonadota bacterium]
MTDFSALIAADRGQEARSIHLVDKAGFDEWLKKRPADDRRMIDAQHFSGKSGFVILPHGTEFEVVAAVDDAGELGPWCLADLSARLPAGSYRLAEGAPGAAALGWLLAQHRFDVYRSKAEDNERGPRILITGEAAKIESAVRVAAATALVRDLVNTPAADLGPAELEAAVRSALKGSEAKIEVTSGDALATGYPLIAAVGGGAIAARAPRLIEAVWGNPKHPRLAIIGKGVCFDSGGLDIKPASGMRWMKKDMGGAAHALALARLVIEERIKVHLHVLIPAVENAVSGAAYRPGDIVRSRRGETVEIDNTDAEGRLVLADAITKAVEGEPEVLIDFATLTGAARIALGPDLPALFVNDDALFDALSKGAVATRDPVWRMPLWDPYQDMLKSDVADFANASNSPMAGCITAALFLKRFVPDGLQWAHFDTFAWRESAKPGRPKGGEALGLRAAFAAIRHRFADE